MDYVRILANNARRASGETPVERMERGYLSERVTSPTVDIVSREPDLHHFITAISRVFRFSHPQKLNLLVH